MSHFNQPPPVAPTGPRVPPMEITSSSPEKASTQKSNGFDFSQAAKNHVLSRPQTASSATQAHKPFSSLLTAKPVNALESQSQPASNSSTSFKSVHAPHTTSQSATITSKSTPGLGQSFLQAAHQTNSDFQDVFSRAAASASRKPVFGAAASATSLGPVSQSAMVSVPTKHFGTDLVPTTKTSGPFDFSSLGKTSQIRAKTLTDALHTARRKKSESLRSLLDSGNFSDLVLKCGDKEWKLHKSVVCCQSKFFHEACSGDFQEAASGLITIKAIERPQVEKMVDFIYTSSYDGSSLPDHVHAYIAGVKYQIDALEDYALDHFEIGTKLTFGMCAAPPLPSAIATSIELICAASLPAEHRALENLLRTHVVIRLRDLMQSQEFRTALELCPKFQTDVMKAYFVPQMVLGPSLVDQKSIEGTPGSAEGSKINDLEASPQTA